MQPKRSVQIEHNDDSVASELNIAKAIAIDSDKEFIYFEKMADGQWRLSYSKATIADFSKVDCLKIFREN